ncbi:Eco29kI family restriction endonuclease [Rhizobium leguminosarum]|uniref:Eco29kI family restriction endonuclease n=1 Tax=Rhizobium leguminosarum TaxID=384 RepID=A0A7K3VNQ2_RHILE|nr:Eco29kI family restriction endonuclease [Rhizobium leguminosarum]NEK17731.1 Eco29kI family restriction endonuclease [Rhizobium leguminosarum]TAV53073.1 Eco29kI family restriction endonuclease [Rhizobium leguminosarum]
MSGGTYNPLDKLNLGKSVAEALLDQADHPLADIPPFDGAGIYVIYYFGDLPLYRPIAEANAEGPRWPIYIGKAIPSGSRRGSSLFSEARGRWLYNRLSEHRETIASVESQSPDNLKVSHFRAKFLIVDDIWIPLGESLLISTFKPLWNRVLDGFGNHDPGSGRYNGLRPLWDALHPGRGWAMKCRERPESMDEIERKVTAFLEEHSPPRSGHMRFAN